MNKLIPIATGLALSVGVVSGGFAKGHDQGVADGTRGGANGTPSNEADPRALVSPVFNGDIIFGSLRRPDADTNPGDARIIPIDRPGQNKPPRR